MWSLAVICGNYINASSIVESLDALGWEGRIACLKERAAGPVLAELFGDRVEIWETDFNTPSDLITYLRDQVPSDHRKIVFFTDERFHEAFRCETASPQLTNTRFFVGSASHISTILDRHAFYRFIEERRLAHVPRTVSGDVDPWSTFPHRFLLRMKRSWDGMKKLRRVLVISTQRQMRQVVESLKQEGLGEQDWCYQELLSISPRHNVSICGWHGPESPIHLATRKVLQHPRNTGNGDVCELIEPPPGLIETADRLLSALEYTGPFELEFALDRDTLTYKVIELNPRFWLQHGLVGAVTGQELVRRYLGFARSAPISSEAKYWMNTFYTAFRLMRCDMRVLPYLTRRSVQVPSWPIAVRWLPRYASRVARRLLDGHCRRRLPSSRAKLTWDSPIRVPRPKCERSGNSPKMPSWPFLKGRG